MSYSVKGVVTLECGGSGKGLFSRGFIGAHCNVCKGTGRK